MPIDRTTTLRNAEKLLRQGKLDAAITEYLRVVTEQPRDWNTANVVGDLYVRAGQIDKAVEQFVRIADGLYEDGFYPKAGALYKKVLKLKPDHEHSLLQAAEAAASQGLLVDARGYLNNVAETRRARGDKKGAAEIVIRLASFDPNDFNARIAGAAARVDVGDVAAAISDLKVISAELTEKGRQPEAFEALRQAALLDPEDAEVRERLIDLYVASGDFAQAREYATTPEQFRSLAAKLEAKGHSNEALDALRDAARLDPSDLALRTHLAQAYAARGDMHAASEYLTAETAGNDPRLLMMAAEIQLRAGHAEEGIGIVRRVLEQDPSRGEEVAMLGWNIAAELPDAAFRVVELAADTAVAQSDWGSAAAALQEFVTRVPNHVPALMRLVEICVDGGLEATMYSAQAQLADAYIAAGSAAEARFIAEDLVAREPWDRSNIERFRRALELLGEPDPEGIIAQRLSGESPFTSTDLLGKEEFPPDSMPPEVTAAPPSPPALQARVESPPARAASTPPPAQSTRAAAPQSSAAPSKTSKHAIDLGDILGEAETPAAKPAGKPTKAHAEQQSVEVDLSIDLGDMKPDATPPVAAGPKGDEASAGRTGDIDTVFARFRDEASRRSAMDAAEEELKRALALRQAGKLDESIQALKVASRSPRLRFQAATLIGRIYRERELLPQAIEWFEHAAAAPVPTADEGYVLLYELADALESVGEVARALAICLELQADAGDYRDIAERIDRLAKVQTRG